MKLSGKKVTSLGQKMELKFNMQRGERGIRKIEFFFGTKNEFFGIETEIAGNWKENVWDKKKYCRDRKLTFWDKDIRYSWPNGWTKLADIF